MRILYNPTREFLPSKSYTFIAGEDRERGDRERGLLDWRQAAFPVTLEDNPRYFMFMSY